MWIVVISKVGIISTTGELKVSIVGSLRIRIWILERKMRCFKVIINTKSFYISFLVFLISCRRNNQWLDNVLEDSSSMDLMQIRENTYLKLIMFCSQVWFWIFNFSLVSMKIYCSLFYIWVFSYIPLNQCLLFHILLCTLKFLVLDKSQLNAWYIVETSLHHILIFH